MSVPAALQGEVCLLLQLPQTVTVCHGSQTPTQDALAIMGDLASFHGPGAFGKEMALGRFELYIGP